MGKYVPNDPTQNRLSVEQTLLEAEQDHFLDCPDAALSLRSAAFLLDCILTFLMASAVYHLSSLGLKTLTWLIDWPNEAVAGLALLATRRAVVGTMTAVYWVILPHRYGGSPGKLLLGLRIVDSGTGELLGTWRAIVREFILKPLTLALSPLWIFLPRSLLFPLIHDRVCRTVVKRVRAVARSDGAGSA